VIIGKNSRSFAESLNLSKPSTVGELQRGLPSGLGAFRTIRLMLLSMYVVMGRRKLGSRLMVVIGVFLANSRTVRFAHGSHGCVSAEQRH
jgi:hypothetical protein